jgi:hypothetical protein
MSLPDLFSWPRMRYSFHLRSFQNSGLASIPSGHVCVDGPIRCFSSTSWIGAVRNRADARSNWTHMAGTSRISLYPRCWTVRSKCHLWSHDTSHADLCFQARWPERSWPGSFDIWGSSHQIFHVLVVMAAASHLYGLLKAFDYHHGALELRC